MDDYIYIYYMMCIHTYHPSCDGSCAPHGGAPERRIHAPRSNTEKRTTTIFLHVIKRLRVPYKKTRLNQTAGLLREMKRGTGTHEGLWSGVFFDRSKLSIRWTTLRDLTLGGRQMGSPSDNWPCSSPCTRTPVVGPRTFLPKPSRSLGWCRGRLTHHFTVEKLLFFLPACVFSFSFFFFFSE